MGIQRTEAPDTWEQNLEFTLRSRWEKELADKMPFCTVSDIISFFCDRKATKKLAQLFIDLDMQPPRVAHLLCKLLLKDYVMYNTRWPRNER